MLNHIIAKINIFRKCLRAFREIFAYFHMNVTFPSRSCVIINSNNEDVM